jgi:alanine racemase
LEVDVNRIEANTCAMVRKLGQAALWSVVKGDGYGIGLERMAVAAAKGGCHGFVCADPEEGVRLRAAGLTHPILCLTWSADAQSRRAVRLSLDLSLGSRSQLDSAASLGMAAPLRVQVEVDTGMGRGGFLPAELGHAVDAIRRSHRLVLTGLWSHLANAADPARSARQRDDFAAACAEASPATPRHLVATGGLSLGPDFLLDGARVGLGCLGLTASRAREQIGLRLAIRWTTGLATVFERAAGATSGYGLGIRLGRRSRLGLVPVGLSDGYPRLSAGVVGVAGRLAPILGTVGMTSMVVDLTDGGDVAEGDIVSLLDADGPDVDDLLRASKPDVVPNSFLCARTGRVALRQTCLESGHGLRTDR